MTSGSAKSAFLVDPHSDPVVVRVIGRASLQNSASLHEFVKEMAARGKDRFVLDFLECPSMDSTFLGVLAGAALELRRRQPPGSLVLARLGPRNLELVRNLGLQRLMTVDTGGENLAFDKCDTRLDPVACNNLEQARLALAAHEHLVAADESNRGKFEDVLTFLKSRVQRAG